LNSGLSKRHRTFPPVVSANPFSPVYSAAKRPIEGFECLLSISKARYYPQNLTRGPESSRRSPTVFPKTPANKKKHSGEGIIVYLKYYFQDFWRWRHRPTVAFAEIALADRDRLF
jgi:hypothetical protein